MEYKYRVSCRKERLIDVRDFVYEALDGVSIPEPQKNSLILAVDEICANLIIHSHHCDPDKFLDLRIDVEKQQKIIFEITDYGTGFDIGEYRAPSINEIVRQRKKGGIGLILVKKIMDKVEYIEGKDHNIYRLSKNL